jgi:ATP-dependent DNA helicase RecQ
VPLTLFDDDNVVSDLQQLKLTGLVAEEAQRISELSFDFNIAYDRVPNVVSRLGRLPTLAVLRSAPPSVRTDLPHRLGLRNAQRVDLQPLPDTIALEVPVVDVPHRGGTLLERLGQAVHPVMVLCSAPEEVDEVVEVLGRASINFRVSAALSAVGMAHVAPSTKAIGPAVTVGISAMPSARDPLPRTIIHYRSPASLEQYARDLGRLDTAQEGASAIVLAATEDEAHVRQWLDRQRPRPEDLIQVATLITQHAGPGKMALVDTLIASSGMGRPRLESLLGLLASAGWVEHKRDWVRIPESCPDLLDRARAFAARLKSLRERDHQRMRSVSAYVIGRNCRHESMRRHFGTAAQRPCGVCDNCRTKATHAAASGSSPPSEPEATASEREPEVIFE